MTHIHDPIASAQRATRKAIADGTLTVGPCELDGDDCTGQIEPHHDDYGKPLEVRWLCKRHHRRLHNGVDGGAARKGRANVAVTIYLTHDLAARLRAMAEEDGRSLSSQIVQLVQKGLRAE